MLAERLPTILPRLDSAAALEVTAIHSVAGVLPDGSPLLTAPPFCAPHHTSTKAAIIGGGSGVIHPGAASLAHHGCLFLDEAPNSAGTCSMPCGSPLRRRGCHSAAGLIARFPARFICCWRRIRAHVPADQADGFRANVHLRYGAGIWPGCLGHCSTGWM